MRDDQADRGTRPGRGDVGYRYRRPSIPASRALLGIAVLLVGVLAGCQASRPAPHPAARAHVSSPPRLASPSPPPLASPSPSLGPAFPSALSANHRFLLDQHGNPYFLVGDSPQCMATSLTPGDMDYFFADRQAHGFNAMWADILCGPY